MSFEMDLIYLGVKHPCSNLIKFLYKSSAFIFDHNSFYNKLHLLHHSSINKQSIESSYSTILIH